MDLLLFQPTEFARLYSCEAFNVSVSTVPVENRRHLVHGIVLIMLFLIFELLYIPCMISLYWHRENHCYKLLFYIGATDMLVLLMNGLETGLLGIEGAVFCSHPVLIYTSGAIGLSLWYAETVAELLLAINRCFELIWPELANTIYGGNRTWWLCLVPTIYAVILCFFTEPILFSGLYFSWFFNPYVGYKDDFGLIYHSKWHSVHDYFVIFGLSTIYIVFSVILSYWTQSLQSNAVPPTLAQKMTFLQVVIISLFNALAAGIYIYMQTVRASEWLIILGTYAWLLAHGSPPIIYLVLNRTICKDCRRMGRKVLAKLGLKKATVSVVPAAALPVAYLQLHQHKTIPPKSTRFS